MSEVADGAMKAELVPENGDPPIPISRDLTLVGRHEDCDIVVPHPSLSKRHCLLVKTDGLLVIRDLVTTNGTKVKGQRVRWAALLPEDRVSFGAYKVRIYLGSDEMPAPSEQRRGRNGAVASRGTAPSPGAQGEYSRPKVTGQVPPASPAPRILPPGFPEPSLDGTAAADWETAYGARLDSQGTGGAEPFEGGFELVEDDDDDDIIELD
jgi:predicted component of type VI protein secretion system